MKNLKQQIRCLVSLTAALFALSAQAQAPSAADQAEHVRAVAENAYVYGMPLVMNYAAMYSYSINSESPDFKAPFNQLYNTPRVFTPQDKAVVTPNSDTPYSIAWLDLRAEPIVITVPQVDPKRYYSVMLCAANTYNYGIIGSIATQGVPGDYLVVGPDWQGVTPKGMRKVFRSGTQHSLAVFRTQLFGAGDMENVKTVQAGYRVQPLSSYLHQPAPPAPATIDYPKIDKELVKKNFFAYLDFALRFAPATSDEISIRAELASIGIGNGRFDEFKAIAAQYGRELGAGMKAGDAKVDAAVAQSGHRVNGWRMFLSAGGDREHFAGDWRERALIAKAGIYALDASEVIYAATRSTPSGEALDGSRHRYTLTFAAGTLPPANAFWSLTMYDSGTQLLVDNPINRYLINSPMLPQLKRNTDGSITLLIQKDSPDQDKVANWLPAPDGLIYMVLRVYGPQPTIRKAEWVVPAVMPAD